MALASQSQSGARLEQPSQAKRVPESRQSTGLSVRCLVAILAVVAFEVVLLANFIGSAAPLVPAGFDQAAYLTASYRLFQAMQSGGIAAGLAAAAKLPAPQGVFLVPFAAFVYAVSGPGRFSALDVNLLFFIAYLAATALLITRAVGPRTAVIAVGMLVSVRSVFLRPGGIADFRYDHVAMCLWGMLLTVTVFPIQNLSQSGQAAISNIVTLLLISTRLIVAAFTIPLFAIFSVLRTVTARSWKWTDDSALGPTLLPGIAAAAATLFICLLEFKQLLDYYIRGHVTGNERSVRASEFGATDALSNVLYYPTSLIVNHLGSGATVLLCCVAVFSLAYIVGHQPLPKTLYRRLPRLLFTGLAVAIPCAVLTLDQAKSPIVGSILVPPTILFVVCLAGIVEESLLIEGGARGRRVMTGVAVVVAACAVLVQLQNRLQANLPAELQASYAEAGRLHLTAGDYIVDNLNGRAIWSVDTHNDLLWAPAAQAYYYESHGRLLELTSSGIGDGPVDQTLSPQEIIKAAEASDVLVLTRRTKDDTPPIYPADAALVPMAGPLRQYADANLLSLGNFRVYGKTLTLYVRPAVSLEGTSGDWITADGIDVAVPRTPWHTACARLEGAINAGLLPAPPTVLTRYASNGAETPVQSGFDYHGESYQIWMDVPAGALADGGTLHVDFSTSFVPAENGISPDTRHLVVRAPSTTRLTPGACTSA